MKVNLIAAVLIAAASVTGCGRDADDRSLTDTTVAGHHDSSSSVASGMRGDSSMMGGGMMSGGMMQQIGQMNTAMMQTLGPADSTYDQRFIDVMVAHHQGAIMMAEDAVKKAVHPELKAFAQKVITDQRAENAKMFDLRAYSDDVGHLFRLKSAAHSD